MASKSYQMSPVYWQPEENAVCAQAEDIASSKGLSMSTLFKRCLEACLPVLKDKKNIGKPVISGTVTMDVTPPRRKPRGGKRE